MPHGPYRKLDKERLSGVIQIAGAKRLFSTALCNRTFTTLGDMLGLPVIPPVYSLRILPYVVPHLGTWKRRVLRPREMSDNEEFHLHGM